MKTVLPAHGLPRASIEQELTAMRAGDRDKQLVDWDSHTFLYTFNGGANVKSVAESVYLQFLWTDALSAYSFPSVKQCQDDLIAFATELLGGDDRTAGRISTGGTESIILALKCARNWAREAYPEITSPEIVCTNTAHPAFLKASHILGLRPVVVPAGADFSADMNAVKAAMNQNTIAIIGSAPAYWHGVYDPIDEMSDIALSSGVWLHVDACLGGLLAPFVRDLGYPVPRFDLSLPGVRSISADFHKYGYSPKGVSAILFRSEDDARHTIFEWAGGIDVAGYRTPGLSGTRSGGAIAAAWAVMKYLGREGFVERAASVMRFIEQAKAGIEEEEALSLHVEPQLSVLSIKADGLDVEAIGAAMAEKGWLMNVFGGPPALHLRATPANEPVAEQFVTDLRESVRAVARGEITSTVRAGVYAD